MELPDWLRGIVLIGRSGAEYRVVGVDDDGYLGVILQAAAEVTIPGDVSVDQNDSIREMQGADGPTLRTVAVDANGQIIMVPRGSTGNYMAVDASGYLTALMRGWETGVGQHSIAVDANGQIIMVPRGEGGNYLAVDASGYLGAILMADAAVTIADNVTVEQDDSVREMQGADGPTLRTVAVDANGQIIMVPRGSTGNYMSVDANGFMSTVIKGIYGATLKTLATDDEGNMIALLKDTDDQWGYKISVGIGELAARLGSPMNWDKRGQVVRIETFADGFGSALTGASGTGALVILQPTVSQMGGYSCQLTSGTTVNRSASVTIYSDYSPSGRVGFEAVFSMADQPDNINITATIWTGVYNYTMGCRLNKTTGQLQVYNSADAWVNVLTYSIPAVPQVFFTVKIVLDLDTQHWVRLLAKGAQFDLSAIEAKRVLSAVHPYITFSVQAKEDAAVSHTIYVDRMIITTNEP